VTSLLFHNQDEKLLSASSDATVRVWDIEKGKTSFQKYVLLGIALKLAFDSLVCVDTHCLTQQNRSYNNDIERA
jgi:WD40 repeat protein